MRLFLIEYLEPLAYLLYTVILFIKSKQDASLKYKVLFYYYTFSAFLLFSGTGLVDNNWNYNLLFLLTVSIFSWYFYSLLHSDIKKIVIIICYILNLIMFFYYDTVLLRFFGHYNNYVYAVTFITIVIYAIFYFHKKLTNVKEDNLLSEFDFWLISGYLLYFLGAFIIILYYKNADFFQRGDMWQIQNILLFISSIITLTGLFKHRIRSKISNA